MAKTKEALLSEYADKQFKTSVSKLNREIKKDAEKLLEHDPKAYNLHYEKIEEKYTKLEQDFILAELQAKASEIKRLFQENVEKEKDKTKPRASSVKPLSCDELNRLRAEYIYPNWKEIDGNISSSWLPDFVKNTRRLLSQNNLKNKDLAEYLNLSEPTVSGFLQPDNPNLPKINHVINIAKFFGVSLDYLIGRTPYPNEFLPSSDTDFRTKYGLSTKAFESLEEVLMGLEYHRTIFSKLPPFELVRILYESNSFKRMIYHLGCYLDELISCDDLKLNINDEYLDEIFVPIRKHDEEYFYEHKTRLFTEYAQAHQYFNDIGNEVSSSRKLSFLFDIENPHPLDKFYEKDSITDEEFELLVGDFSLYTDLDTKIVKAYQRALFNDYYGILSLENDACKFIALYCNKDVAEQSLNIYQRELPNKRLSLIRFRIMDSPDMNNSDVKNGSNELIHSFNFAIFAHDQKHFDIIGLFPNKNVATDFINKYRIRHTDKAVLLVQLHFKENNKKVDTTTVLEKYDAISIGDETL